MKKQKLIVIVGQTATGKSDLAVEIAKKVNGAIISADSRQVYKGLDIGSGKITKKEMRGVEHFGLDILDPKKEYTVAQFKKYSEKAIDKIVEAGKVPILVGGSGFYIDAVTKNIQFPNVVPNIRLRKHLQKKTVNELAKQLQKLDPDRFANIDAKNPVRLIRAIEIALAIGKVPNKTKKSIYEVLLIGIQIPQNKLEIKILNRLKKRMKQGMVKEVKELHQQGLSWKRMESLGLEYRYVSRYVRKYVPKKISKDDLIEQLNRAILQFSRKQRMWFSKNKNIQWFRPSDKNRILSIAKEFVIEKSR